MRNSSVSPEHSTHPVHHESHESAEHREIRMMAGEHIVRLLSFGLPPGMAGPANDSITGYLEHALRLQRQGSFEPR